MQLHIFPGKRLRRRRGWGQGRFWHYMKWTEIYATNVSSILRVREREALNCISMAILEQTLNLCFSDFIFSFVFRVWPKVGLPLWVLLDQFRQNNLTVRAFSYLHFLNLVKSDSGLFVLTLVWIVWDIVKTVNQPGLKSHANSKVFCWGLIWYIAQIDITTAMNEHHLCWCSVLNYTEIFNSPEYRTFFLYLLMSSFCPRQLWPMSKQIP